jgi:hypothetical protein
MSYVPACPSFHKCSFCGPQTSCVQQFFFFKLFFLLYNIEILAKLNKKIFLAKSLEFTTQKFRQRKFGIFLIISRNFHKIGGKKKKEHLVSCVWA